MKDNPAFGEIIGSSLISWSIQCWNIDRCAPFGAIITCDYHNTQTLGIITSIETGPQDASYTPFTFKKTIAELHREHPEIFEFIITKALALPLGTRTTRGLRYHLPTTPPPLHSWVAEAPFDVQQQFFATPQWLHALFSIEHAFPLRNELIIAALSHAHQRQLITPAGIKELMHTVALLQGNDYRTLKIFLQRLQPFVE